MSEEAIIEKLLEGDEEFKKIYTEHRELDEKIKQLENQGTDPDEDEIEVKRLKKIKLSLKDQMEAKIRSLR